MNVISRGARLRAAEAAEASRMHARKLELIAGLGSLQESIGQRYDQLRADEQLARAMVQELEAIERGDQARARALAPSPGLYLTMGQACELARVGEATMRKRIRKGGFGWKVDGRWRISRPDLVAYEAALDG